MSELPLHHESITRFLSRGLTQLRNSYHLIDWLRNLRV